MHTPAFVRLSCPPDALKTGEDSGGRCARRGKIIIPHPGEDANRGKMRGTCARRSSPDLSACDDRHNPSRGMFGDVYIFKIDGENIYKYIYKREERESSPTAPRPLS